MTSFIYHKCDKDPVLAVQLESEIKSPISAISISELSVNIEDGSHLTNDVYASRPSTRADRQAVQLLNFEGKAYESDFTHYSITSEDTHSIIVYNSYFAIGYVTWTLEVCDDNVERPIIQQLFLLEDYWRQGIGETLTGYLLEELPQSGETVWLNSPNVHMMNVLDRLGLVSVVEEGEQVLDVDDDRVGITGSNLMGVRRYIDRKIG